jgi:ATP-dependent RNA helicase DDX41
VGLVVCPSRELARQTQEVVAGYLGALRAEGAPDLRSLLVMGGTDMRQQARGPPHPPRPARPARSIAASAPRLRSRPCRRMAAGPCSRARAGAQTDAIRRGVHTIVATPGRLKDLLAKKRMSLDVCKYLCLDEADRMVDMGFEEDIREARAPRCRCRSPGPVV